MKRKRFRYWKHTLLAAAIILAGVLYCLKGFKSEPLLQPAASYPEDTVHTASVSEPETIPEESEDTDLYVYVCGEVLNPGVYVLSAGQRLFEAVDLAGGFTDDAAPEALNLAMPVSDGMKIDVPDRERARVMPSGGFVTGSGALEGSKVNINTATREQLMTLNGIGGARADAIIAYREEHGGFSSVEDIMQVSGIKEALFAKIKNDITVR